MSPTATQKAFLWPSLLYALAQVAGEEKAKTGEIWVRVPDSDHLKLLATDGVALLTATVPSTHTCPVGETFMISAADHKKKPSAKACSEQQLLELRAWKRVKPPFDFKKLERRLSGDITAANLDPIRAAAFFKAVSSICQRVELKSLAESVFFQCPHPIFEGEVRGAIANLAVMSP